jgi:serine/threonine-protein kinase
VSQLLQEAITVARFSHPNIVGVYDVEDSPGAAFIAMELVDGTTLGRHLAPGRALPPPEAVPLCAAIARALEAAHARGIVHRDVKPGNVLLGRDGSIKVTDFGIAELLSSLARREEVVFGTPGYLPPEALLGEGYDQAGDVFALGAVMYRCLTGHPAIPGKDPVEVARNTVHGATPMSEWGTPVPEELEALVMGLLATRRVLRQRTAGQVAELLERMAGQNAWRWTPTWAESDDRRADDADLHALLLPTLHLRGQRGQRS